MRRYLERHRDRLFCGVSILWLLQQDEFGGISSYGRELLASLLKVSDSSENVPNAESP